MDKTDTATDTARFFEALYRGAPTGGVVSLWDRLSKESAHVLPEDAAAFARGADLAEADVYFGVGLRRAGLAPSERGKGADVITVPGAWLDLDVAGPGHASANLPTIGRAIELLGTFEYPPSLIVDSGGGLHVYWLFTHPVAVTTDAMRDTCADLVAALQARFIEHAKPYHVDKTADLARVLRVPGTRNRKLAEPRPVVLVGTDEDARYDMAELAAALSVSKPRASVTGAEGRHAGDVGEGVQAIGSPQSSGTPPTPQPLSADEARAVLANITKADSRELVRRAMAGEAFAQPGARDEAMQRLASIVAFAVPGADPADVAALVGPGLDAIEALAPVQVPAREAFADKFRRARAKAHESYAVKKSRDAKILDVFFKGAASADVPKYTDEETAAFAAGQRCTPEEFRRRWIIKHGAAFYVFVDGKYRKPIRKDDLDVKLREDLERAPVDWWSANNKPRKPEDMLREYSTVAREAVASLTLRESYYDARTETFHEAVCPIRNIEPAFNPEIQRWLEILGGEEKEKLLDWVATVTHLDRYTSGVLFVGPGSTGKTLFANGLARLWTVEDPAKLEDVLGTNFNDPLTKCPLIFADEFIPGKRDNVSGRLRELIGSTGRPLKRKFLDTISLGGAVRLVIASNNDSILSLYDEDLTADDQGAIAERFLYIHTPAEAKEYLYSVGGTSNVDAWIREDKLAAHALWLRDNRTVQPGKRFLVPGTITRTQQLLATRSHRANLVYEFIARYLEEAPKGKIENPAVIAGGGKLLVNASAVVKVWADFIPSHPRPPSAGALGRVLTNLARAQGNARPGGGARYHDVDPDPIFRWAETNNVGDVGAMRAQVEGGKAA